MSHDYCGFRLGALVSSSRAILYPQLYPSGASWSVAAVREAMTRLIEEVRRALA